MSSLALQHFVIENVVRQDLAPGSFLCKGLCGLVEYTGFESFAQEKRSTIIKKKEESKMPIKDEDFNKAKSILTQAGSSSAGKAHVKHTQGKDSPDGDGKQLLQEARDEFRETDVRQPNLKAGMTQAHYDAIVKAATEMGITEW